MVSLLDRSVIVKAGCASIDFSYIRHGIGSLKCRQFVFAGDSPRSTLLRHSHIVRARNTKEINAVLVRNLNETVTLYRHRETELIYVIRMQMKGSCDAL